MDVHFQAEPTKAAVLRKTYAQKKKDHSSKLKQSVLDKYGGMEHLKVRFFISEDHNLSMNASGQKFNVSSHFIIPKFLTSGL